MNIRDLPRYRVYIVFDICLYFYLFIKAISFVWFQMRTDSCLFRNILKTLNVNDLLVRHTFVNPGDQIVLHSFIYGTFNILRV